MPAFDIRPGVTFAASMDWYECKPGDPTTRPLRVYAVDPSLHKAEGCVATIQVPYEPLAPGPIGKFFEVECADGDMRFSPLDLESPRVLISSGLAPGVSNPAFHQQMVYAVASSTYATFRTALGRLIAWSCDDGPPLQGALRLKLRPHVETEGANACYDECTREIRFGYAPNLHLPGGRVFACLSHDIIVHEVTHALIDGLRSRFTVPTNPDVLGFHEGLSDLIAVLHHFLYPDVIAAQIAKVGPGVERSAMLTRIASNFGLSTIGETAVRDAVGGGREIRYNREAEPHQMGIVLVTAVFEAFVKLFRRQTERYLKLAGPQPVGYWSSELVQILAEKAAALARSFLNICIRALDYCPPVDLELGEYLRALITADYNLVPADPWGFRETLIGCFAERGILPKNVIYLSEDALLWRPPSRILPPIPGLSFSDLKFNGDPSIPASAGELKRQATALGKYITQPHITGEFGLMEPSAADEVDPPAIQSIRVARRVGPDGQVLFDLVAEVTQRRIVTDRATGLRAKLMGGSTIVIGPRAEVRYVISKNIQNQERVDAQFDFQKKSEFWTGRDGQYRLAGYALAMVHKELPRLPDVPVR